MEKQFAVKTVQHLQTYWAILERVRGSSLRLTKMDDDIYEHLKTDFPEFDPAAVINEDEMKSKVGKERWRKFLMAYEKKVDDYNFGTMLRNSPKVEYEEDSTLFGKNTGSFLIRLNLPLTVLSSPPYAVLRRRNRPQQERPQRLDLRKGSS